MEKNLKQKQRCKDMHSEQTELHLLHMVERAQMGMQGEEKEIEELLFGRLVRSGFVQVFMPF